jgi:transposase-like protein
MSEPNATPRPCPKCRADMFQVKSLGPDQKWKCTRCHAFFFFDELEDEAEHGQMFLPTVAEIVGRHFLQPL